VTAEHQADWLQAIAADVTAAAQRADETVIHMQATLVGVRKAARALSCPGPFRCPGAIGHASRTVMCSASRTHAVGTRRRAPTLIDGHSPEATAA
jgi:hypothetical protein